MRLAPEQQKRLKERGICANEAFDTCGKVLGAVRYTRRGEPGEWCSELCRDGVKAERRRGGRPRKYLNERQSQRARAEATKRYRGGQCVIKTPSQVAENA